MPVAFYTMNNSTGDRPGTSNRGTQVCTMYFFEKQTQNAFSHIEFAYLSFMVSISIAVFAFVVGNFI